MIRRILVPLDSSPHGAAAGDYALQLAAEFDATVVALGVVNEPALRSREPVPLGAGTFKVERDQAVLVEASAKVHELLEDFCHRCSMMGIQCDSKEAHEAAVKTIILESQRCDLLVMGAKSHFTYPFGECCTTVDQVVKQTPRPVIVVPEKPVAGQAVVVAYDGSLAATKTLQAFELLGLGDERRVYIVSVHSDEQHAADVAGRAVDFLRPHGLEATAITITSSEPAWPLVLKQVEELEAGLLVMGSHGHSSWYEMIYGSWTRWTMQHTQVPLLVYH